MSFLSEKELFSWTYLLKKTPQSTNVLISPLWNKILKIWHTFWVYTNRSTMQQKLFQFFVLPQEARAFGNNIEKEPQKPRTKLENMYVIYLHREYLLCLQSNEIDSFLQTCINFAEQQLKFSHFKTLNVKCSL